MAFFLGGLACFFKFASFLAALRAIKGDVCGEFLLLESSVVAILCLLGHHVAKCTFPSVALDELLVGSHTLFCGHSTARVREVEHDPVEWLLPPLKACLFMEFGGIYTKENGGAESLEGSDVTSRAGVLLTEDRLGIVA